MNRINQLINTLSDPSYHIKYTYAKNTNSCVICGKQAEKFSSLAVKFEYNVSAICEKCQNKFIYGKAQ